MLTIYLGYGCKLQEMDEVVWEKVWGIQGMWPFLLSYECPACEVAELWMIISKFLHPPESLDEERRLTSREWCYLVSPDVVRP